MIFLNSFSVDSTPQDRPLKSTSKPYEPTDASGKPLFGLKALRSADVTKTEETSVSKRKNLFELSINAFT